MSAGWDIVGDLVSCTCTVKLPLAVMPDAPVAEQLTTLVPSRNVLPEDGVQVRVGAIGFASLAVAVKLTAAPEGVVASTTILPGRLSTGGLLIHATRLPAAFGQSLPTPSIVVAAAATTPASD